MSERGLRGEAAARAPARKPDSYERIVRAAYKCFERYGIDRTSIEDIAREAGVTRPTVYRYFAGKTQIVDLISAEESQKVNAEVRKRLVRGQSFEDLVTEALVLIVRIAIENPYIRRTLSYRELEATAESSSSELNKMHRVWWGRALEQAAASGELAPDIDIDEVLLWLTLTQHMLLTRLESGPMDDEMLRRVIRRFVVAPMLARSADPKATR